MLKDRQYLETKLIKRITEINGNRVNNRLIHQQWYIKLAEKYNLNIKILMFSIWEETPNFGKKKN